MRNKKLKIVNISSFSDALFNNPDPMAPDNYRDGWEKFSSRADYIILTNPELKKTF